MAAAGYVPLGGMPEYRVLISPFSLLDGAHAVVTKIFEFLSPKERALCARVSKLFEKRMPFAEINNIRYAMRNAREKLSSHYVDRIFPRGRLDPKERLQEMFRRASQICHASSNRLRRAVEEHIPPNPDLYGPTAHECLKAAYVMGYQTLCVMQLFNRVYPDSRVDMPEDEREILSQEILDRANVCREKLQRDKPLLPNLGVGDFLDLPPEIIHFDMTEDQFIELIRDCNYLDHPRAFSALLECPTFRPFQTKEFFAKINVFLLEAFKKSIEARHVALSRAIIHFTPPSIQLNIASLRGQMLDAFVKERAKRDGDREDLDQIRPLFGWVLPPRCCDTATRDHFSKICCIIVGGVFTLIIWNHFQP